MNQVPIKNDAIKRPHHSLKQCAKDEIREPSALKCDYAKPRERKSKVDLHVTPNLSQFNKPEATWYDGSLLPNLIACNWAITCERIVDKRGVFIRGFCPPMAIRWWGEMIRLLLHPSRHLFQSHYMLLTVPTPNAQAAIHPGIPSSSSPHTTSPFDLRRSTAQLLLLIIIIPTRPISYRQFTSQTMRT